MRSRVSACRNIGSYRPFDGTDAAVTDPSQMKIELQPVGRPQGGSGAIPLAPDIVQLLTQSRTLKPSSKGGPPTVREENTSGRPVIELRVTAQRTMLSSSEIGRDRTHAVGQATCHGRSIATTKPPAAP
jgi:hypothetical protein